MNGRRALLTSTFAVLVSGTAMASATLASAGGNGSKAAVKDDNAGACPSGYSLVSAAYWDAATMGIYGAVKIDERGNGNGFVCVKPLG